jgi:collagenase-like PrtC family protease
MLADHARFVAGPGLNVYHADMLAFLVASGAMRWVPPRDMGWDSVQAIVAACPRPPGIEIAAWSRLPLDFPPDCTPAMRCARLASRAARRGRTAIAATHPYKLCCLVESLPALRRLHVERVRVDAQRNGMPRIVRAIRAALDGEPPREVAAALVADRGALVCDHADESASDHAPPSPEAIAADR